MAIFTKTEILDMYDKNTLNLYSLSSLGLTIYDDSTIMDRYTNVIDKNKLAFWCDQFTMPIELELKSNLNIFQPYVLNLINED